MKPLCFLTLKSGKTVPESIWLPESPTPKPPDSTSPYAEAYAHSVKEVHAFVEAFKPNAQQVTSVNQDNKYYVIIGRGFAALTDHVTLRRSTFGRERLGELPVVHVGFPDPWLTYTPHNMNQGPELNLPPGYAMQPNLPPPAKRSERWLASEDFSGMNQQEEAALEEAFERENTPFLLPLAVSRIEEPGSADDPYLVHLHGDSNPIKAEKIDICTGTGQQTLLQTQSEDATYGVNMTYPLWKSYVDDPRTNAGQPWTPEVISAEMYVLNNIQVPAGALVCITGASPASIQAAEHALSLDRGGCGPAAEALLVNSGPVNGGFLPIGRLDGLARLGTRQAPRELPDRYKSPEGNLIPWHDNLWFAEGYRVDNVRDFLESDKQYFTEFDVPNVPGRKLLVKFKVTKNPRLAGKQEDYDQPANFQYAMFDQVVFGTGRTRGYDTPKKKEEFQLGAATSLVWPFKNKFEKIDSGGYGFPVGVQTKDKRVRLLGAAGLNSWLIVKPDTTQPISPLAAFEASLPVQARVNGEGICLSATAIAYANKYFESLVGVAQKLNYNLNTATLPDLIMVLDYELGADIYDLRHWRIGPFICLRQLARALLIYRAKIKGRMPDNPPRDDLIASLNDEVALANDIMSVEETAGLTELEGKLRAKAIFSYARNDVIAGQNNQAK